MPTYEVQIPDSGGDGVTFTMQIEALDWMSALTDCLDEFGQDFDARAARCSLAPSGAVHVSVEGAEQEIVVRPLDGAGLNVAMPLTSRVAEDVTTRVEIQRAAAPQSEVARIKRRSLSRTTDPMVPMALLAEAELTSAAVGPPSDGPTSAPVLDAPGVDPGGRGGPLSARYVTRPGLPVSPRPRGQVPRKVSPTRLLAALNKLSSARANAEQVIDHAVALVYDEVAADAVQMVLPDHSGAGWRVVAARGREAGAVVLNRLTLDDAVSEALAATGEPLLLSDDSMKLVYESRRGRSTELAADAVMMAPITDGDDRIGAVLLTRDGTPFDPGVTELMRRLGKELGQLLGSRL